jgi:hypothetical protein
MIDPASRQNWIDPPDSIPPLPFASNDPPDDIDKALDALAEAIRRAEGGERKSMASYLMRLPAVSLPTKILAQLPSSQLMAFLERHRAENDVVDAMMPSIAASGADDRMARANLFRRITMAYSLSVLLIVGLRRLCPGRRRAANAGVVMCEPPNTGQCAGEPERARDANDRA